MFDVPCMRGCIESRLLLFAREAIDPGYIVIDTYYVKREHSFDDEAFGIFFFFSIFCLCHFTEVFFENYCLFNNKQTSSSLKWMVNF